MMNESSLPIGGSLLVAIVVYVLISLFVTGPLIGGRVIENSSWHRVCPSTIRAEIESRRAPRQVMPPTDCQSIFGSFMPELGAICRRHGNPDFGGPITSIAREQERARREAEDRRIGLAAAQSSDACTCAANVFLEEERVALAIHAGSARLITPPEISSLNASLARSLRTPACNLGGM